MWVDRWPSLYKLPIDKFYDQLNCDLCVYTVVPHPMDTPVKRPSDTSFGSECIYVCLCTIKIPETWNRLYSLKWTNFPVPTVTELCKIHSLIQILIYCFCKIVHHLQWIQRLGISTVAHLANLSQCTRPTGSIPDSMPCIKLAILMYSCYLLEHTIIRRLQ